jgi:hypothetical protein
MLTLRFFNHEKHSVVCGWDLNKSEYHVMVGIGGVPLVDEEIKSISEMFDIFKKFQILIPNSLMMDLLEDKAEGKRKIHHYANPVLIEPM